MADSQETKPKRKKKTKLDKIIEKLQAKICFVEKETKARIELIEAEQEAELASLNDTITLLKEENGLK